jgi:HSP20 family molecular chaperone IbpA
MASTKTSLTSTQQKTDMVAEHEQPSFLEDFHNLVQRRAYALFEDDGYTEGNDLTHWLKAEDEFVIHPAIHESASAFTLKVSLGANSADRVKVFSDENRAVISANTSREETSKDSASSETASAYYSVRWPEPVDPNTATAQMNDGVLTLTAQKASKGEQTASTTTTSSDEKSKSA